MTVWYGIFAFAGFLTLPLSQNPGFGLEVNVHGPVDSRVEGLRRSRATVRAGARSQSHGVRVTANGASSPYSQNTHSPPNLVVTPQASHKTLDLSTHLPLKSKESEVSSVAECTAQGVLIGVFSSWTHAFQSERRPLGA